MNILTLLQSAPQDTIAAAAQNGQAGETTLQLMQQHLKFIKIISMI